MYAIGAAAAGYDPNALRHGGGPSVMAYLAAHAASACALAGPCGQLIQAVVAAGLNPGAFGGVDLLTTLAGLYTSNSGAFGDGTAFTQALAVQGLVAASQPVPAAALHLLVIRQDSDGGWGYLLAKDNPNASQRHQLHGDGADGARRRRHPHPGRRRARLAAHSAGQPTAAFPTRPASAPTPTPPPW